MKYILINIQNKQQTLCDKVTIDENDYYISSEKPNIGDWVIEYQNGDVIGELQYINNEYVLAPDIQRKVIATKTFNQNINITKVMDEVEMLVDTLFEAHSKNIMSPQYETRKMFIEGYNKAKEIHTFSEEDMIDFAEWKIKNGFYMYSHEDKWSVKSFSPYYTDTNESVKVYTTKELLQFWREQRIKIFYYNE